MGCSSAYGKRELFYSSVLPVEADFLHLRERAADLILLCIPAKTARVSVSSGNSFLSTQMDIATVMIFSGEMGSHKKVIYPPPIACSTGISQKVPTASRIYAQPFVIIQAIPNDSTNLGLSKNRMAFLIKVLSFCILTSVKNAHTSY